MKGEGESMKMIKIEETLVDAARVSAIRAVKNFGGLGVEEIHS